MLPVRATGLVKRYEHTAALDGVDFTVGEGQLRGLLGPNGAGKTTLLRVLFGLISPDAGQVELFGQTTAQARSAPGTLKRVGGFVEEPGFYPYLSARANLGVLAELDGDPDPRRIEESLSRVGLVSRAGDRVGGYSTGMRQRLGIAASLLRDPRLLLLDEPTAGLDPAGVRDVSELVLELCDHGVAVVISSHHIGELEALCDSFTVLHHGQVAWDGTAAELRAQAPASSYELLTSDDDGAVRLAGGRPGLTVERASGDRGLTVTAAGDTLDAYVIALGQADIAVRRLELRVSPLESMFFTRTAQSAT